jgi:NitT/TauT family transport system substrate-binding protein
MKARLHVHLMRTIGAVALVVLFTASPHSGIAQNAAPLRVAATLADAYAEAYYAQDAGFFAANGLNVDLTSFASAPAIAEAVPSGAIDIGVASALAISQAVAHGVPLRIVAAGGVTSPSSPATTLCVAGDSTIRTAKDLEGKTLAVIGLKTISEVGADTWLDKNHADISKIHVIEMTFPQMGPALERGTIAAAVLTEPSLSQAKANNHVRELANTSFAIAPRYLSSAWFAAGPWADKNPDLIARFAKSIYEAGRWANANHDKSLAILAKYAKVDVQTFNKNNRIEFATALDPADLKTQLDLALKYGALPRQVTAAELTGTLNQRKP